MKVFAISDLHLPGGERKPMDVFGAHWERHFERVAEDWRARVGEGDLVLLPGDLCWAMTLSQAMDDIRAVGALPGAKIILRGNHDFWWSSISRLRAALPEGMVALQNNAVRHGDVVVCGTRGWLTPGGVALGAEDQKIYLREIQRLSLSLADAQKKREGARLIAMLHYPPFPDPETETGFTKLLEEYGVTDAVYGHLHGAGLQNAFSGELRGVRYHQASCDGLGFRLLEIV